MVLHDYDNIDFQQIPLVKMGLQMASAIFSLQRRESVPV